MSRFLMQRPVPLQRRERQNRHQVKLASLLASQFCAVEPLPQECLKKLRVPWGNAKTKVLFASHGSIRQANWLHVFSNQDNNITKLSLHV